MPKRRALSAKEVEAITKTGLTWVDDNLYLQRRDDGTRCWIFRYERDGKVRSMGLGPMQPGNADRGPAHGRRAPRGHLERSRPGGHAPGWEAEGQGDAGVEAARSKPADDTEQETPLTLARRFRDEQHPTLLWQGDWLLHRGSYYAVVEPDAIRRDVYAFIEEIGGYPGRRQRKN